MLTATTSLEHLHQRRDRPFNLEVLLDTSTPGTPKAQSQLRVSQQLFKRLSKRIRIARWSQQSGLAVNRQFGNSGQSSRNDWPRRSHRFENYSRKNIGGPLRVGS